jgi:simple sugar transport system ATP-binding protein
MFSQAYIDLIVDPYIYDKPMFFRSPEDAIKKGIFMVHQHFKLVKSYNVLENIILGTKHVSRKIIGN